jgi:hypothetical protein
MPTLALAPSSVKVSADSQASEHWNANLGALRLSQPMLAQLLGEGLPERNWVFARDGSITALGSNGRWWADCSVPLLASRAMLKTLQSGPASSCLLCPNYAGLVVAAREKIGRWTTLMVIQPDVEIARMILACHDFSEQIRQHRLWLVTGESWMHPLRAIFSHYAGLATPLQFIRTKLTPEAVIAPIISDAQAVFAEVVEARSEQIEELKSVPISTAGAQHILLIGASQFRLWDDDFATLHGTLSNRKTGDDLSIKIFDSDQPLAGSPVALLQAAKGCACVISANLCRPDCNNLLSVEIPWITWMTHAGAPPFESAGPKDWLLLADPGWRALARKTGWPDDRVRVCGFPSSVAAGQSENLSPELALLSDTRPIEIPASVTQYSSHRLLWELIEEELAANPFAVETIDAYLDDRSGQLNIGGDVLDRQAFRQQLILPAYEQGLARILISVGAPVSLWGAGWAELEEFESAARGDLIDRDLFRSAIARATALVYCWPEKAVHPIGALGKPIVHRAGSDRAEFIRNVQRALSGTNRTAPTLLGSGNVLFETLSELVQVALKK